MAGMKPLATARSSVFSRTGWLTALVVLGAKAANGAAAGLREASVADADCSVWVFAVAPRTDGCAALFFRASNSWLMDAKSMRCPT